MKMAYQTVASLCAMMLFGIAAAAPVGSAEETIVRPPCGPVSGLIENGIRVFKGIPYAKPPLGDLRFAPPENVEPWTDVRPCKKYGNIAMQQSPVTTIPSVPLPASEDCLTLNIWTPEGASGLPVYVFIHGGAYAVGSGADPILDGTGFAKSGIVSITINYRLNALGFLATRETLRQYGTTGNWGHLDQIKALEWIRDNIAAFGGDPEKVTIGGESAGAFSVSALMLSPLAKGLFRAAILESGNILATTTATPYARGDLDHSIEVGAMFADMFGAADDVNGLSALRRADAEAMAQMSAFDPDFRKTVAYLTFPVFDGRVLPREPLQALENGKFNRVKLLFGFNADEGSLFVPPGITAREYKAVAARLFGRKAETVLAHFPAAPESAVVTNARKATAFSTFIAGMRTIADAYANKGLDVYGYFFTHVSPRDAKAGLGARHAAEIPYTFNNIRIAGSPEPTPDQLALEKEMHTRWANFIKSGNPNHGEDAPSGLVWPKHAPGQPRVLRFDAPAGIEDAPFPEDTEFMRKVLLDGK